jgi:nickel/cobalt transporter (NiCoT) family protein
MRRVSDLFTEGERRTLAGLFAFVAIPHVAGWALCFASSGWSPTYLGLGWLAYSLGMRHAFDADHIAAIDNTTRRLAGDRPPLSVGFFFSLGHSSVVFALAASLAVAAAWTSGHVGAWAQSGQTVAGAVSGGFLLLVAVINLVLLIAVVRGARDVRRGQGREPDLAATLTPHGPLTRLLARPLKVVREPWHMYPLGILFGLGLDTAGEVMLLALNAGAASGAPPTPAVLALPLLFAAGMCAFDTADGILMSRAYGWGLGRPGRRAFYNAAVTAFSVLAALSIGMVQLLGLGADLEVTGYALAGAFFATWVVALATWHLTHMEQRWEARRGVA